MKGGMSDAARAARMTELREELAQLETQQRDELKRRLSTLFDGLSRPHMQLLRDLLNERIKETYDGDDE